MRAELRAWVRGCGRTDGQAPPGQRDKALTPEDVEDLIDSEAVSWRQLVDAWLQERNPAEYQQSHELQKRLAGFA